MNRLTALFAAKTTNILSIYTTVGFPKLQDTSTVLKSLDENEVDFVEIGMPFSDPLADGPTIQESSKIAIKNGITMPLLFEQIRQLRTEIKLPLVFMGYFNQVLKYGVPQFCQSCNDSGIDGVILPDLPIAIFEKDYKALFEKHDLKISFLITPETSNQRIKEVISLCSGFLYVVSSHATTGTKKDIDAYQLAYFERIKKIKTDVPKIIGFGIANKTTFDTACKYTNGAIVGSAFIKAISHSNDLKSDINSFIKQIRE